MADVLLGGFDAELFRRVRYEATASSLAGRSVAEWMKWRGVWVDGVSYQRHDVVTYGPTLMISVTDDPAGTLETPVASSPEWDTLSSGGESGYGQLSVPAVDSATVTISATDTYYETSTPAWTLSATANLFDESGGNGRLTYIGPGTAAVSVSCAVSTSTASNSQVTHWRLAKNGTTDPATEIIRKTGTGGDIGALALGGVLDMTENDYLSLWCSNESSTADIVVETASIRVEGLLK